VGTVSEQQAAEALRLLVHIDRLVQLLWFVVSFWVGFTIVGGIVDILDRKR